MGSDQIGETIRSVFPSLRPFMVRFPMRGELCCGRVFSTVTYVVYHFIQTSGKTAISSLEMNNFCLSA